MKKLVLALVTACLLVTPCFAHYGALVLEGMTLDYEEAVYWEHDETLDNPDGIFKGSASVTVTNTGDDPWGDFHFAITNGFGGSAVSVLFEDDSLGGEDPTSSQALDYWTISNPVGGLSSIDLYFYGDPLLKDETATFTVYTDNTAENLSWFGMEIYPTPVPEPATMLLLSLGGLAVIRRKK